MAYEAPSALAVRRDLVISEQHHSTETVYVIKDPATGRYFRMLKEDHDLLSMLDGSASLEQIVRQLRQKHGHDVDVETVRKFVAKLDAAGLLDDSAKSESPLFRSTGVYFFQRILWIRLKAFNPDRFFTWAQKKLRLLFSTSFVVLASLVICCGLYLVRTEYRTLGADMHASFGLHLAAAFWVLGLLIAVLHECAHGLTCKSFGGEVRELGVLLIYLNLALFCNVSDAWLFPERRKRFWVMFSGAFFEAFLWASAVLVWRHTSPGTRIHVYALIVVTISGVKNLLNLLPLIKLDGYYLLSDMLEIPNLRRRSFDYCRQVGLHWLLKSPLKGVTPREKVIYLTYGGLAVPFSLLLIGFMYLHLARFLIHKYGQAGEILTATILVLVFGDFILSAIKKLYGKLKQNASSELTMSAPR